MNLSKAIKNLFKSKAEIQMQQPIKDRLILLAHVLTKTVAEGNEETVIQTIEAYNEQVKQYLRYGKTYANYLALFDLLQVTIPEASEKVVRITAMYLANIKDVDTKRGFNLIRQAQNFAKRQMTAKGVATEKALNFAGIYAVLRFTFLNSNS